MTQLRRRRRLSQKGTLLVAALSFLAVVSSSQAQSPNVQGNPVTPESVHKPNPDANGIYNVADGVTPPKAIQTVDPEYSDLSRKLKLSGTCLLALVVDEHGNPQDIRIQKSIIDGLTGKKLRRAGTELDANAVNAVQRYRFTPAMYQGHPVKVHMNIEISYRIR